MKARSYVVVLCALALTSISAKAAEAPAPKTMPPMWEEGSMAAQKFEDLNKDLRMDEKKKAEFRKMFEKYSKQQTQAHDKLQMAVKQLDQTSHDATAKESAVKDRLEAVERALSQILDNRTQNHEEMRKFFGTIGYARFVAFEEGLRGEIRSKARAKLGKKMMTEEPAQPMTAESAPVPPEAAAPAAPQQQAPAPATK